MRTKLQSYMTTNIIEKLKWRYATKKFDASKKLSEAKLNILIESFNLTATSYGLQPIKMVVIGNADLKQKLVPITMNQEQVNNASHVLVICTETEMDAEFIKDNFKLVEETRKTARAILDPFETFIVAEFSAKSKTSVDTWMAKQAYLALGNLLTVCALEDIDSCPIEGFEPEKYDELLKLNDLGLKSVLVLAVGYRAEDDLFSGLEKVRRGVDEVIIEMK
ncbi:MAG: nitroreductase/dihydropteridine reductase [Ulvibacter sp.]|jgi:nitroreductase/dihydropteridine reductase